MSRTRPIAESMFNPNIIFIMMAIAIIIAFCILFIPVIFKLNKKGIPIIRQMSYLALFSSAFLIIFATILFVPLVNLLTPFTFTLGTSLNLMPFGWLREPDVKRQIIFEVIPNILMFIPLGCFLPIVFKKIRKISKVFLIVCLISISIEFLQYFIGRSVDVDDIILNTLGGIIGYEFFKLFNSLFKNKMWWNKFNGKDL